MVEALKLAFADRERYYRRSAFVDVPLSRLLSDAYAAERRAAIRRDRAYPGMPPAGDGSRPKWMQTSEETRSQLDTSYVCVIDRHGNVFSATPSDTSNDRRSFPAPASSRRCAAPSRGPKPTTRPSSRRASARA